MEIGYVVETSQGVFICDKNDMYVSTSLRDNASYGTKELSYINRYTNYNSKVLWIGTHIGALTVPVAKRVMSVTAIEANPHTFKLLQMNLRLNELNNVKSFNVAAGETNSSIEFVLNTHNSGGSKRKPSVWRDIYYYDNPETVEVPLKRMDDFLFDRDYDVLFMDIEGSEYFALQGMPEILKNINVLILEFFPFLISDVAKATVSDLFPFFKQFKTLIAPNLGKFATHGAILPLLHWMFENGHCEEGLIFLKDEVDANLL